MMMKSQHFITKSKRAFQQFIPTKVIKSQLHSRTFKQFALKTGLVYFGYVDQRNDEHSLVRGLTVSTKHRDNNYCIGSFEGYDITIVERTDTVHFPGKEPKTHNWVIMAFDLHQSVDLPHVFLGLHTHGEAFYAQFFTKYAHMARLYFGTTGTYDVSFLKHYMVFAQADQAISAERLIHPALAKTIAEQFHSLAIEIHDGTLYIYAEHHHPSAVLLDKMLSRGIWLAKSIDAHDHIQSLDQ
ncbi:MAG: hypothetical protein ABWX90_02930 [Candidatus Saccharimonadales bacterium]